MSVARRRVENVMRRTGLPASTIASRAFCARLMNTCCQRETSSGTGATLASKSRTISTLSRRNWYSLSAMTDSMTSLTVACWRSDRDCRANVSRFSTIFLQRRALISIFSTSRRDHCSVGCERNNWA
jgi:hypothetical protein